MRILKSIGFKFVLGILVLGFSMSCSDDNVNNKTAVPNLDIGVYTKCCNW